ncbi:uncharacterized protein [Rutidosis leptorrhynchoides]|uniref:uncharacterized protein n=1 Tax=Rutidosis leptorrhynchoides TaxID=125765 RepID=UPI003A98D0D3
MPFPLSLFLQKLVDELKGLVNKLQKGEAQLLKKVADLEKNGVVSSEKEVKLRAEYDILMKEKEEIEGDLGRLTEEKTLITNYLNDALKSLRQQNLTIDQLVKEKTNINDAKSQGEINIVKLQEQLEELKNTIATLEKASTVEGGKIKQLESELSRCKAALDQTTNERNNVQANLDGEKLKGKSLSEKISELEKGAEEMSKKLTKMQKVADKAVAEKKELEKARSGLANEILVVKKSLAKTQKEFDDTKGKLKLSEANTSQILKLLKKTALICNSKEDGKMGNGQETEFGQDIKYHVKEVEAIKKAFKDKEIAMDEMKKQVELLKVCVAKADKAKSFWTMVSSATTLLAAVSLACVARTGN